MKKYWLVFVLSFQNAFEYRFNLVVNAFKYAGMIMLLALVWLAVNKEQPLGVFTTQELIVYYVFAGILYGLSNYHLFHIQEDIKLGYISKLLIKPISPFFYYFWEMAAVGVIETVLKAVVMLPILWLFGYWFVPSIGSVLILIGFLPLILLCTFCIHFAAQTLAFWFQEVFSIRITIMFVVRLLSGVLVPISLFPSWYQAISRWLPFQQFAYAPIQVLLGKFSTTETVLAIVVLVVWTIIFFRFQAMLWRKATHSYEATGI